MSEKKIEKKLEKKDGRKRSKKDIKKDRKYRCRERIGDNRLTVVLFRTESSKPN